MIVSRQITRRCASCAQRRRRIIESGVTLPMHTVELARVIHWSAGDETLCARP